MAKNSNPSQNPSQDNQSVSEHLRNDATNQPASDATAANDAASDAANDAAANNAAAQRGNADEHRQADEQGKADKGHKPSAAQLNTNQLNATPGATPGASSLNDNDAGITSTQTATEASTHATSQVALDTAPAQPMRKRTLYWRRFRRNKMAMVGLGIFIFLALFAIFGPYIARYDFQEADFLAAGSPPSPDHWFGTNAAGNDLFAMTVHGLGRSLTIAVTVSLCTVLIAAFVGTTAALLGGRPERVILAIIHFLLVIPSFLIIALMVSGSGGDWRLLTVVLIAFGWMYFARVIWSMAISLREREYVQAARYMGVTNFQIVRRHLIPNIASLLVINATLGVVSAVMSETGLSFLGLGVKIPDVSLGTLLASGANSLVSSPWEFFFPATVLTLLTVSMAFIADGLRDALDPNSTAVGRVA